MEINRGLVMVRDRTRVEYEGVCFKHDLHHRPRRGKTGTDRTGIGVELESGGKVKIIPCTKERCRDNFVTVSLQGESEIVS